MFLNLNGNKKKGGIFMISKSIALEILNACLATGGDYAEIYVEQCDTQSVTLENGKVETGGDSQTYGAGIRIYKELQSVFGYTNDLSKAALLSLAEKLSSSFDGERIITVESIQKVPVKCINPIKSPLNEVSFEEKVAYLKSCYEATKAVSPLLVRIIDQFYNEYVQVEIFSASGIIALTTLLLSLAASFLGKGFGSLLKSKAEVFGGVILILIGVKILLEHTLLA